MSWIPAGADPASSAAAAGGHVQPRHALFAKTLFIDPPERELRQLELEALVLDFAVEADPEVDGTRSGTFVRSCTRPRSEVLIGGTYYAGEIKKSTSRS